MPAIGPISRRDLIPYLRKAGWDGPYAARHHDIMVRGTKRLPVPNPHQGDIAVDLLLRILRQAGIDRETWEAL